MPRIGSIEASRVPDLYFVSACFMLWIVDTLCYVPIACLFDPICVDYYSNLDNSWQP